MDTRRLVVGLVAAGIVSLTVGVGVGALLNLPALRPNSEEESYQLSEGLRARLGGGSSSEDREPVLPGKPVTLAGVVLPVSGGAASGTGPSVTYQLVDKDGQVIARLESTGIELSLIGNSFVTIVGEEVGTGEGGVPLVRVEKVQF